MSYTGFYETKLIQDIINTTKTKNFIATNEILKYDVDNNKTVSLLDTQIFNIINEDFDKLFANYNLSKSSYDTYIYIDRPLLDTHYIGYDTFVDASMLDFKGSYENYLDKEQITYTEYLNRIAKFKLISEFRFNKRLYYIWKLVQDDRHKGVSLGTLGNGFNGTNSSEKYILTTEKNFLNKDYLSNCSTSDNLRNVAHPVKYVLNTDKSEANYNVELKEYHYQLYFVFKYEQNLTNSAEIAIDRHLYDAIKYINDPDNNWPNIPKEVRINDILRRDGKPKYILKGDYIYNNHTYYIWEYDLNSNHGLVPFTGGDGGRYILTNEFNYTGKDLLSNIDKKTGVINTGNLARPIVYILNSDKRAYTEAGDLIHNHNIPFNDCFINEYIPGDVANQMNNDMVLTIDSWYNDIVHNDDMPEMANYLTEMATITSDYKKYYLYKNKISFNNENYYLWESIENIGEATNICALQKNNYILTKEINFTENNLTYLVNNYMKNYPISDFVDVESNDEEIPNNYFCQLLLYGQRDPMIIEDSGDHILHRITFDQYANNIQYVNLGQLCQKLDDGIFKECSKLEQVNINGENIQTIPREAFTRCTNLKTINMSNSINLIGPGAFSGCTSLESITIPVNVNRIDNKAFMGCENLKNIYVYPQTPPTIFNDTFQLIVKRPGSSIPPSSIGNQPISQLSNNINNNGMLSVYTTNTEVLANYKTQWLKNDAYYLGYYNWYAVQAVEPINGIGGRTPSVHYNPGNIANNESPIKESSSMPILLPDEYCNQMWDSIKDKLYRKENSSNYCPIYSVLIDDETIGVYENFDIDNDFIENSNHCIERCFVLDFVNNSSIDLNEMNLDMTEEDALNNPSFMNQLRNVYLKDPLLNIINKTYNGIKIDYNKDKKYNINDYNSLHARVQNIYEKMHVPMEAIEYDELELRKFYIRNKRWPNLIEAESCKIDIYHEA